MASLAPYRRRRGWRRWRRWWRWWRLRWRAWWWRARACVCVCVCLERGREATRDRATHISDCAHPQHTRTRLVQRASCAPPPDASRLARRCAARAGTRPCGRGEATARVRSYGLGLALNLVGRWSSWLVFRRDIQWSIAQFPAIIGFHSSMPAHARASPTARAAYPRVAW